MIAICNTSAGNTYSLIVKDINSVTIKHNEFFKHIVCTNIDNVVDFLVTNEVGFTYRRCIFNFIDDNDIVEIRTDNDIWFETIEDDKRS